MAEEQAAEMAQEQEPDYKAMYEQAQTQLDAAKADAEKWKSMSRKNEARAKAAAERSDNAEIAALQDKLAAMEHERDLNAWVHKAIKDNGLTLDDAPLISANTEEEVIERAKALKTRIDNAPKFSPYKDSGETKAKAKTPEQVFADFMKGLN